MDLFLKKIKILPSGESQSFKIVDILIKDGLINKIGKDLRKPKGVEIIDFPNAHASIGWMDIGIFVGEPGFEHREDFNSVKRAAAKGGFTSLASLPNTDPVIDNKAQVEFVKNQNRNTAVIINPLGAISVGCNGQDLAELYDMHACGAVAFTDGQKPVQSSGLMLRALQYAKAFDGLMINASNDRSISSGGQINEGALSISLGLKGIPHLSEELMVQRDIELTEYADSKMHISNISTAGSVELIRKAKKKGIRISASVPIFNLLYEEKEMEDFDANFKVWPPLRTNKDRKALKKGLLDGTIDFISSNHTPLESDMKKKEFPYAAFGAIGLETLFSLGTELLDKDFKLPDLIKLLAYKAREVLSIETPLIKEGEMANLTIFNPSEKWAYGLKEIKSKSKNTPLIDKDLVGKVYAIVNNNSLLINS